MVRIPTVALGMGAVEAVLVAAEDHPAAEDHLGVSKKVLDNHIKNLVI